MSDITPEQQAMISDAVTADPEVADITQRQHQMMLDMIAAGIPRDEILATVEDTLSRADQQRLHMAWCRAQRELGFVDEERYSDRWHDRWRWAKYSLKNMILWRGYWKVEDNGLIGKASSLGCRIGLHKYEPWVDPDQFGEVNSPLAENYWACHFCGKREPS